MMQNDIYTKAAQYLGKHITLNENVPPDEGCAEAVSYVLKNANVAGIPTRGIAGTWDLYQWLLINKNFVQSTTPEFGGVVISPTGTSSQAGAIGHCGIILKHGIASNSSASGRFEENYNDGSWHHYFHDLHGFPVYYFIPRS